MARIGSRKKHLFIKARILFLASILSFTAVYQWFQRADGQEPSNQFQPVSHYQRHLLQDNSGVPRDEVDPGSGDQNETDIFLPPVTPSTEGYLPIEVNSSQIRNATVVPPECTPPAYHEFPPDLFSQQQRSEGAIVIHCLVVCYMFLALAIVCDDYFVASLDKICEKLGFSADVAGATFMAAGSSAPELCTSLIGVFVTKGDVGVGTIVGSAVFNILFVIGLCGILAGQIVPLSSWPLLRDSLFYGLSVITLIGVISDGSVSWYEAVIMLAIYSLYILAMRYNPLLHSFVTRKLPWLTSWANADDEMNMILTGPTKSYGDYERFNDDIDEGINGAIPVPPATKRELEVIQVDVHIAKTGYRWTFHTFMFRLMIRGVYQPKTRFKSAVRVIVLQRRKFMGDSAFLKRQKFKHLLFASTQSDYSNKALRNSLRQCLTLDEAEAEITDDWKGLPPKGENPFFYVKWAALYPIRICLYYTIPDCRKKRWEKWYMATFGISIVWIALFSYAMVWMVTLIGYTIGIPDSIMGITFLAAGTSIPDAIASVLVARQGLGDMAISNTIGSNVFDILIGLALPWFVSTCLVDAGSRVHINSNGMVFSVMLLFLSVIITILSVHVVGWVLNKKLGIFCMISYGIFLIFSILIEFNVFGYVNPPMCRE